MKKERSGEIMQEISRLREILHQIFNENKKVTKEVLAVSTKLDQRINSYFKLVNEKNNS